MIEWFSHLNPDHPFYGDGYIFFARDVEAIDFDHAGSLELQEIIVKLRGYQHPVVVSGFPALELVWAIKPGALEGKRIKFHKHSWAIHNLVAHPAMQLLAFIHCYKAAMWIHDITVPKPSNTV
jgi:hypothetical protein